MEDQKQSFICKICTKSFNNWRSLGGHMRCHVTTKTEDPDFGFDYFQDCDDSSYALRENPKKTWRVEDKATGDKENRAIVRCSKRKNEEHNCKQCGKVFGSMRALFGHMRHHSGKRSGVLIDLEKPSSGLEILCPIKKKRSKLRYKVSGFCSVSDFSLCEKVSEFNKEEEAALGLIMLSSGFTEWDDFVSDFDSCESDSLVSKAKALNMKLNAGVSEIGNLGIKISGQEIGVEMGDKNDSEIKSGEIRIGDQDTELGMNLNLIDSKFGDFNLGNQLKKPVISNDLETSISDSEIRIESESKIGKETSFVDQDTELGKTGSVVGMEIDGSIPEISENCEKKPEIKFQKINSFHECPICFKVFPSGQALGGHKRAHFLDKKKDVMVVVTQESAAGVSSFCFGNQFDSGFVLKPFWASSDHGPGPVGISNR